MDLRNLLPHKANTKVLVNGTVYDIDKDGIAKDVKDEDAKKMLQSAHWDLAKGVKPKAAKSTEATKPLTPAPKDKKERGDGIQLLDSSGDVVNVDPPIPEKEGDEWADPDERYSWDWLKACAEAYGVKYKGKSKSKMVEKIQAEMYDE
jgi:hypothetical protein